jgi:glycosyltransferase involved in cell wall biosynthesis
MSDLRVLFWIRRRAAPHGGDLVALEYTITALRARGVTCDVSDDPAQDLGPYALVHLYNLADPYAAVEYVGRAQRAARPLVVTPIYWRHTQWLAARRAATLESHPEFFPGDPTLAERAFSERVLVQSEELAQAVTRLVCTAAARVFCLSQAERDFLKADFEIAPEKTRLTYNGVDPAFAGGDAERFAREFGLRDFILSAARIERRKNTIGVIRAWRDEPVPLVFAGHAPDPDYLALCQREAGPNVHFVGTLTPSQIADACAAARVHVLASWWEEVGLAALEAGLAGCNLVMTQNGPAREYFGPDCFLCDPADPASIRRALRAACDASRPAQLARRVGENFTWERTAATLCADYAAIVAHPERHLQPVPAGLWMDVGERLAELLHWREEYLSGLETRARATAAWAHELEGIAAVHDAERARFERLPLARLWRSLARPT